LPDTGSSRLRWRRSALAFRFGFVATSPTSCARLRFREFAVRSGAAAIWVPRLQMAEDLDHEADRLDPVEQDRR
jgi:hypothetical protein